MTRTRKILLASLGLVVVLILAVGTILLINLNKPKPAAAATSVPVPVSVKSLPDDARVGVVVTYGDAAEAGTAWNRAANGAQVAVRRLAMGGHTMELAVEGDRGTQDGAREAVQKLAKQDVFGIVVATEGPQVAAAVKAAQDAGIPAILPYSHQGVTPETTSWSTAPTESELRPAFKKALGDAQRPLLIKAQGEVPGGIQPAQTLSFEPGADMDELAHQVALRTGDERPKGKNGKPGNPPSNPADAVVIAAVPSRQAVIVQALQARNVSVPVILGTDATSPAFSTQLAESDGAASASLVTAGGPFSDAVALQRDDAGRAMSAFLAADRLLADDAGAKDISRESPFADVASVADSRSHDAVIALAQAASAAGSGDPQKVEDKLGTLHLTASDGIAGPELDFGQRNAFAGEVSVLHASNQNLALRPDSDQGKTPLTWFPAN